MTRYRAVANLGATLVTSAALLFSTAPSYAATTNTVTIESATIAANELTLTGDFGTGAVSMLLAAQSLPIVSSSPTEIVATLNPVPAVGTYRVLLQVGNKSATAYASVSPKIIQGFVNPDGSVSPGTSSPITVVHAFAGNYRVEFPAGTFQIGSPYLAPVLAVKPLFGLAPANVVYYFINGDQSGSFIVDFGGIDTLFTFTMIQTY
jgi:hypothetical protein